MKLFKNLIISLMTLLLCVTNAGVRIVHAESIAEDPATFDATFEFITDDKFDLPEEVIVLLPETRTGLVPGDVVTTSDYDKVTVDNYVYSFEG